jgi:hypothetical protein
MGVDPNLDLNLLLGMFGGLSSIIGSTLDGKYTKSSVTEPSQCISCMCLNFSLSLMG